MYKTYMTISHAPLRMNVVLSRQAV